MTKVSVPDTAKKITEKSNGNAHSILWTDEKYRRHLCQYSKSVVNTIDFNTNTATLTALANGNDNLSSHTRQTGVRTL